MTLKDQLLIDASAVFCNADDFAESVVYHPHRFFGEEARAARTITAVVIRPQVQVLTEDGEGVLPLFEIHVANSNEIGISSDEIDVGKDEIELPVRDGKDPERRTITRLIDHDQGMLQIQCQ